MDAGSRPLVFATVGTDHHRFDRLVSWVDGWFGDRGEGRSRCVIQWGTSSPPVSATGSDYFAYHEMQELLSQATIVVTHGGPATIMECRRLGIVPVSLPRRSRLGEHVDDHQVDFNRRLAASGDVVLCEEEGGLRDLIDRSLADPAAFRMPGSTDATSEAVARFGDLVDRLASRR